MRSTVAQLPLIKRFVRRSRRQSPRLYRQIVSEAAVVVLGHTVALGLAVLLHGPFWGALAYGLVVGVPALLAPGAMMFTNYLQHAGCDAGSADRHSRNFVDPTLNWLFFNAGYHTVHHDAPRAHWSQYAELHRLRRAGIGPDLEHGTLLGYCWKTYAVRR